MIDIQKFFQRNSRRILAFGALLFSLFLFSLLMGSGPSGSAWVVKAPIATGTKVVASEVALEKIDLGSESSHFFGAKDQIIGQYALHALAVGDVISLSDLGRGSTQAGISFIPIGVLATDCPTDILPGDFADIYVIPKDQTTSPALVISHVDVENVDSKSRSLGGSVELALSVTPANAVLIVDAESQGRLVVASNAF
jgi:hypothetical protein